MSRYHCRCRKCQTRKVLPRHPDHYEKQPECPGCRSRNWRPDAWMNKRKTGLNGMGCNCSGYWFFHRKGSLYCWHRADGTMRAPGDNDFNDRHLSDDEIAAAAAQIRKYENVATIV